LDALVGKFQLFLLVPGQLAVRRAMWVIKTRLPPCTVQLTWASIILTPPMFMAMNVWSLVAQLRKERKETVYVATKAGPRFDPHMAGGYSRANLTASSSAVLKISTPKPLTFCSCIAHQPKFITCQKPLACWMIL
jgi:hypothetical protein